ncbi:MAG: CRISPR-associated protein Cas4 [Caldilineaceae bacterium]|nr:CRISPR-associated protein Cas4 [Caldilineaceae bacterium]
MSSEILGDPWYFRVVDLKQHDYCPRVVYYEHCLPGVRPTTYKMQAGIKAQDRVESLEKRRSLRAYDVIEGVRHFNVSVQSAALGLSGQIDLVVETGVGDEMRLIPVDFKLSRRKPGRHFKVQLACYALLLEESRQVPVDTGYLYLIPSRQSIKVDITARLRREVHNQIAEIRQMIAAERMPPPAKHRAQCVNCEFRRFCNDVL